LRTFKIVKDLLAFILDDEITGLVSLPIFPVHGACDEICRLDAWFPA